MHPGPARKSPKQAHASLPVGTELRLLAWAWFGGVRECIGLPRNLSNPGTSDSAHFGSGMAEEW